MGRAEQEETTTFPGTNIALRTLSGTSMRFVTHEGSAPSFGMTATFQLGASPNEWPQLALDMRTASATYSVGFDMRDTGAVLPQKKVSPKG